MSSPPVASPTTSSSSKTSDDARPSASDGQGKRLRGVLQEIQFLRNREEVSFSAGIEDDFVILNSLTLWTDLFVRTFVNDVTTISSTRREEDQSNDDLLFFIRRSARGSRFVPKMDMHVDVFRKHSKRLPVGNADIDWEETLYLNVILQSFYYTLTMGIISRTGPQSVQILKKKSAQVYATPSRRSMHGKAEEEVMSYPDIYFTVDDYEDALDSMVVKDGELVCIELTAKDKKDTFMDSTVLFSGCIPYDPLKASCDYLLRPFSRSRLSFRVIAGSGSSRSAAKVAFLKVRSSHQGTSAEIAVRKSRMEGSCPPTPTDQDYDLLSMNGFMGLEVCRPVCVSPRKRRLRCEMFHHFLCLSCCSCLEQDPQSSHRRSSDPVSSFTDFLAMTTGGGGVSRAKSENDLTEKDIEMSTIYQELSAQSDLWTLPSFGQSFFSWKESKRLACIPLHVSATFVTMKVDQIIQILMTNQQKAVLTF